MAFTDIEEVGISDEAKRLAKSVMSEVALKILVMIQTESKEDVMAFLRSLIIRTDN